MVTGAKPAGSATRRKTGDAPASQEPAGQLQLQPRVSAQATYKALLIFAGINLAVEASEAVHVVP
jgi:hypothetical protein